MILSFDMCDEIDIRLDDGIRCIVGQAAHVLAPPNVHIASVPPFLAPPVLQDPCVFRIADGKHCMIDERRHTRRIIVHPMAVQLKGFRTGIDRNGDRSDPSDGRLHRHLVLCRQNCPRRDRSNGQLLVVFAVLLL